MATFSYTNLFTAGTPAVATQVNTNFNDVRTFAQGISTGTNIDASAISEAKIANNAVTYSKLAPSATQFLAPVGSITMYTGVTAPAGWLLCDGVTSTAGYTTLASLVGATTPNLQGRFPIGDNGTLALNGTGGSLTIGTNNLPLHAHNNTATWTQGVTTTSVSQNPHSHSGTANTNGSHLHDDTREGTTGTAAVSHSHNEDGTAGSIGAGGGDFGSDVTNNAGDHSHSLSISSENANITGVSVTMAGTVTMSNGNNTTTASDYYPPYYVVNYIIKHD
jgi:microcystin-dependent protein